LWVVAVARGRIVSSRSREVVAELEQLLDRSADGPGKPESC
jgi:hypothetical protein